MSLKKKKASPIGGLYRDTSKLQFALDDHLVKSKLVGIIMFVKRRKLCFNNNNDTEQNKNYPFNVNVLTKFCLQHKFDCDGKSDEVKEKLC